MRFLLRCLKCGHRYWRRGEDDPETNAVAINDRAGDSCPECGDGGYEIETHEYDEPEPDDVI